MAAIFGWAAAAGAQEVKEAAEAPEPVVPAPRIMENAEVTRGRMITEQIVRRGVTDPQILAAMQKVPREEFLPPDVKNMAYDDRAIPIGYGQTISQPYVVAFMTRALALKPGDRVLEVGTGSGYQTAVLAELVKNVYTIEILPVMGERAAATLQRLGYTNISTKIGDGYRGWPDAQPFDAVIVTCAADAIPQPLVDQLAEGGRMIIPVGPQGEPQNLVILKKTGGKLEQKKVLPVTFVPMTGEAQGK